MLFKSDRLTESSLPVFGANLAVLGFVFSFVFIGSQPQTPPLQANLAESRMSASSFPTSSITISLDRHSTHLNNTETRWGSAGIESYICHIYTCKIVYISLNKEDGTNRAIVSNRYGNQSTRQTLTTNLQVPFLHNGPEASFQSQPGFLAFSHTRKSALHSPWVRPCMV